MSYFRFFAMKKIQKKQKDTTKQTLSYFNAFVFWHFRGLKAKGRQNQEKIRHIKCIVLSPLICRIFAFWFLYLFASFSFRLRMRRFIPHMTNAMLGSRGEMYSDEVN